ncbi:gp436 family protein [Pinisolibacter sp.]|uniref:gp436 family protein n=1 Tax=Pinisolibacter sp. TaxID=2172024 RepID=UPI002FDC8267
MPYCALADLIDRAGEAEILQVADRDMDGIADPAVIDAAIGSAGDQIDAYLAGRFALPLVPVPAIVVTWAVSIARYLLHRDGAPDHVVRDQRDALAALKDAAAGRLSLPSVTGAVPAPASTSGIGVATDGTVFTSDRMGGFL